MLPNVICYNPRDGLHGRLGVCCIIMASMAKMPLRNPVDVEARGYESVNECIRIYVVTST